MRKAMAMVMPSVIDLIVLLLIIAGLELLRSMVARPKQGPVNQT